MRDRDRLIHSAAFRRLEHKTQVFVQHEGDNFRSRLTHSIEVAQIARTIATRLGLDSDLAETVALAHDLGHTPFGHAGEEALNNSMKNKGGFDHNAQTLRIVTKLEKKYADFDGLNLTWESLEGIVKHNGPLKKNIPNVIIEYQSLINIKNKSLNLNLNKFAGPEAQVAAISDDIAYCNHDIDDGIRAGLFDLNALEDIDHVGKVNVVIPIENFDVGQARVGLLESQVLHRDVVGSAQVVLERGEVGDRNVYQIEVVDETDLLLLTKDFQVLLWTPKVKGAEVLFLVDLVHVR